MPAVFSHVLVIVGLPLLCLSQIDSRPSENPLYQWNTVARCTRDKLFNHFKYFCGIKTSFSVKTHHCTLFNCFFHYNLWHRQNRQVTSHCEYVPPCEWFELKFGMCGEESLLTNLSKFHGDRAASTMFSQHCCKTYWTDLVLQKNLKKPYLRVITHFQGTGRLTKMKIIVPVEKKVMNIFAKNCIFQAIKT